MPPENLKDSVLLERPRKSIGESTGLLLSDELLEILILSLSRSP